MVATKHLHRPSISFDFPKHWRWERLDEICTGIFDCPHSTPVLTSEGPLVVRSQDIRSGILRTGEAGHVSEPTYQDRILRAEPRYGDLLYSREGTYFGIAAEVPPDVRACLGQRMVLLRPDETQVHFRFLRYWLNSALMARHVHGFRDGTVAERLNLPTIRGLPIVVPPLSEQRAIANVLGTLDDKIELNRRMNETLEAMAQALFKSWFIDPTANGLPEGWREGRVSDICTTQYGYTARATEESIGPKFLRVMDINKQNWIDWPSVPHCSISTEERMKYALSIGDILVARMADPGKSAIVDEEVDAVFASYLVRLKTESLATAYYVYYFLKSQAYADYSKGAMGGSVQANMNAKVIVAAELPIPPVGLTEKFLRTVLPLRQRIVSNVNESRTIAALRDGLLPKLMSGELRGFSGKKAIRNKLCSMNINE